MNPYTDFGFKKLFGTEMNKELLISFLNALLPDRQEIVDVTYLNTEHLGTLERDRRAVFDVYCENRQGEKFLVEYEDSLKNFRDWYSVMKTAINKGRKEGHQEGLAEGLAKGLAEGLERGLVEGVEKGRKEEGLNMARRMRADGLSLEVIARYTGLTVEELSAL